MESPPTTSPPRNYLQEFLQDRHIPCPACKHDLHALTQSRCSNCHIELHLGVASVDSYRLIWGILLAFMSINGCVGLLFTILLVKFRQLPLRTEIIPAFFIFIAALPLAPLPLLFRRWFLRQSWYIQWICLGAVFLFTVLAFSLLLLAFMTR